MNTLLYDIRSIDAQLEELSTESQSHYVKVTRTRNRLMMMTMLMILNMVMMASPRSWGAMHDTPQAAGVGGASKVL